MDIADIGTYADTIKVPLRHPLTDEILKDAEGKEFFVEVYGPHSEHAKKCLHRMKNDRLKKAQRKGQLALTSEEIEANAVLLLTSCVKSWYMVEKGTALKSTTDEYIRVMETYPWVRAQIDAAISDDAAFLGN